MSNDANYDRGLVSLFETAASLDAASAHLDATSVGVDATSVGDDAVADVFADVFGAGGGGGGGGGGGVGDDDITRELPPVSRKVARPRHRRRDRPRSKTIALKRLTREELRKGALANPPVDDIDRPATRAECKDMPRPCPFVACKHHLYLDINPRTGSIKINFPDLEPWELAHTCALDVADSGGLTLEEIGLITNLTRERVRQVEVRGLLTLKSRSNSLR
jgi:hypothetical protein